MQYFPILPIPFSLRNRDNLYIPSNISRKATEMYSERMCISQTTERSVGNVYFKARYFFVYCYNSKSARGHLDGTQHSKRIDRVRNRMLSSMTGIADVAAGLDGSR